MSKTSKLIINFERPEYDPLFSPHKLISTTAHETVTVLWVEYWIYSENTVEPHW